VAGVLDAAGEVPEGRYTIVEGEGGRALLDLSGLVDTEKEKARLLAKAAKARKSLEKSRGKLANPAFAAKARPEVVAEEERRAEEAESLLAEIAHRYAERVGEELPT
jgi:valyl-tRNA synthetase